MTNLISIVLSFAALGQPAAHIERNSYRAHLAAAYASHELGHASDARRWLDAAPEGLRSWEWSYLDGLFDESQTSSPGLPSATMHIDINEQGSQAALAMASGPIIIWDLKGDRKIDELPGHPGGTFCARFSPDGKRLVSGGADRLARVWDLASGRISIEFSDHKFPVPAVAFTADGRFIASASYYVDKETPIHGRVHLWDAETGTILKTFTGGQKPISSLVFSPGGASIAAGTWDSTVLLWNLEGGGEPRRFGAKPGPTNNLHIHSIAFSPDGAFLAAGSDVDWARVYRVSDATVVADLTSHKSDVYKVGFSRDGSTLATCGGDGAIRLWNTKDWLPRAVMHGHSAAVRAIAWLPDGSSLFSAADDKTFRSWNPARTDYGGIRTRYSTTNYSVAFTPDGRHLACASSDHTVGLINASTGEVTATWPAHPKGEVCTAAVSPEGTLLASCSWDKSVRIFDLASKREVRTIDLPGGVALIAWHPSGERIAAAMNNKNAVVLDAKTGATLLTLSGHEKSVLSIAYNADGTMIATSSADSTARTWNADTGELIATMRGHTAKIESCAFWNKGSHIVTGSNDGSVRMWNATSGELSRTLLESDDEIYRVAVAPSQCRIAAAGKHLYILDPLSTGELLKVRPLKGTLWHISWSPSGRLLAVTSWDGSIAVLDSLPMRKR